MSDELRDRIAMVLYIESSEAEDGDVVWESPEAIAEEIESWGRFAQAIIDEFGLTVETTNPHRDKFTEAERKLYGIQPEHRVVGKWEKQ